MSQHDGAMVRAKLHQALDRIGHNNGHASPHTSSNIDPHLHEYFVASEGEAYFKKRRDVAKTALIEASGAQQEIEDAKTRVIDNDMGETIVIAQGDAYVASAKFSRPSSRLDKTALKSKLMTRFGLSSSAADAFIGECSKQTAPSQTITVATQ